MSIVKVKDGVVPSVFELFVFFLVASSLVFPVKVVSETDSSLAVS
jgi:hypothetical protein